MIQYKITKPCHQNWDKMTPNAQGKFCAHCQKQVYDLTGQKTIANLPDSFCGRIESNRVATEISFKKLLLKQNPFRYVAISLLLLFTKNVKAQLLNKINFVNDSLPQQNISDSITKTISISGTLIDEKTKESVPFAPIVVTDSLSNKIGYGITDMDGYYNFIIPKAQIKGKSINIMASYVGYDSIIVSNIPIISLKQTISIGRSLGTFVAMGSAGRTAYYIDGTLATQEEVEALDKKEQTPIFAVGVAPYSSDNLFISRFDNKTPVRENITKPSSR